MDASHQTRRFSGTRRGGREPCERERVGDAKRGGVATRFDPSPTRLPLLHDVPRRLEDRGARAAPSAFQASSRDSPSSRRRRAQPSASALAPVLHPQALVRRALPRKLRAHLRQAGHPATLHGAAHGRRLASPQALRSLIPQVVRLGDAVKGGRSGQRGVRRGRARSLSFVWSKQNGARADARDAPRRGRTPRS